MAVAGRAHGAIVDDAVQNGGVGNQRSVVSVSARGHQHRIGQNGDVLTFAAGSLHADHGITIHNEVFRTGVEHDGNTRLLHLGIQSVHSARSTAFAAIADQRLVGVGFARDAHADALEPFDGGGRQAGLHHGQARIVVELADAGKIKEKLLDVFLGHVGVLVYPVGGHAAAGHGGGAANSRHFFDHQYVLDPVVV